MRTAMAAAIGLAAIAISVAVGGAVGEQGEAQEKAAPKPMLRYVVEAGTFIGGSQWEQPREIIPLADGSVVIGGQTSSDDLPVTPGAPQDKYAGEPPGTGHPGLAGGDCFIAKLSADLGRIDFCTYWGGSKQERATYGFNRDADGNIVVCTACRSPDAPTTKGSYQRTHGGGRSDVLVGKLSIKSKKWLWCTYFGGRGEDWPRGGTGLDPNGNVLVVGRSTSPNFPATDGVIRPKAQGKNGDAMIVKLSADGKRLMWATLLGGSDWDALMGVRADRAGNVYVAGHTRSRDLPVSAGAAQPKPGQKSDVWLASVTPDATAIRYCTYLGGGGEEFAEHRPFLCRDGSVLLTGVTSSGDFPTTEGACQRSLQGKNDGFLAKLSPDGKRFEFVTLLGGSGGEFFLMPIVGPDGNIYMVGQTTSKDFPVTSDALQKTYGGGTGDAVLAVLSPDGAKLLYATYIGGSGDDLIRGLGIGLDGSVYLAGNSDSDDLPYISRNAAQPRRKGRHDGFVMKLAPVKR